MATCPNKNLPSWKNLVMSKGEDMAYYLWDKYEGEVPASEKLYSMDAETETELEFHANTLNVVSNFLQDIGIEQRLVPEFIAKDGSLIKGAIAAANFMEGTVDIIEDMDKRPSAWNKLPEEAAHWWYRLLDNNSELKDALLRASATDRKEAELRESLYGDVYEGPKVIGKLALDEAGNVIAKPALSPIREEAIGQLIAEAIKRIEEKNAAPADYTFLKKFIDWLNSLVGKFTGLFKDQDPFEVAAMKILTSDKSDLMSWDEYQKINNLVNFADVISEQSTAPFDYTIVEDLGEVSGGYIENAGEYDTELEMSIPEIEYKVFFRKNDGSTSPAFDTQDELDVWMFKTYGQLYNKRQEQKVVEVRDNEEFMNRLLNKTYKRQTRFLNKTLDKFITIIGSAQYSQFYVSDYNPSAKALINDVTEKMTDVQKQQLIASLQYDNIAPTLKILPEVLKKYGAKGALNQEIIQAKLDLTKKRLNNEITKEEAKAEELKLNKKAGGNPISLSEPIKIDGAKKEELTILNYVKDLIKSENPEMRSISAADFVNEVNEYLKMNYLLGFANESQYTGYRIDQTFEVDGTANPTNIQNLTEEQIQNMTLGERQRLADILGLTNKSRRTFHNKVSLRFNDTFFKDSGHPSQVIHFRNAPPSAWGNLTYFYTDSSSPVKNAVLLHEIQNDNIEYLKALSEAAEKDTNIENELEQYKLDEYVALKQFIQDLNNDNVRANIHSLSHFRRKTYLDNQLADNWFRFQQFNKSQLDQGILPPVDENDISVDSSYRSLIQFLNEQVNLNRSIKDYSNSPEKKAKEISDEYAKRRKLQDFYRKGGLKSKLSAEDMKHIKDVIDEINNREDSVIDPITGDEIQISKKDRKDLFRTNSVILALQDMVNNSLKQEYGKDFPTIKFQISAKPISKARRMAGDIPTKLNDSVNYMLLHTEKQTIALANKNIEAAKKDWLNATKQEKTYDFNEKLSKLTKSQFVELQNNYNYNAFLFEKLAKERSEVLVLQEKQKTKDSPDIQRKIQEAEAKLNKSIQEAEKINEDIKNKLEESKAKVNDTLSIEKDYFMPLVHHLIQKHINNVGKGIPMYFSGYDATMLTQGNDLTASIYAGKDEVRPAVHFYVKTSEGDISWQATSDSDVYMYNVDSDSYAKYSPTNRNDIQIISKQEFDKVLAEASKKGIVEMKRQALENNKAMIRQYITDTSKPLSSYTAEEVNSLLKHVYNVATNREKQTIQREILALNKNRPYQTGALYNLMTQVAGVKLIYQEKIKGLRNDTGGYLVDLSNYNFNVPILYGMQSPAANTNQVMQLDNETVSTRANTETIEKVKKVAEKMGVSITSLADYAKRTGLDTKGINGVADLTLGILAIADGKTDVALTEEMVHIATAILEKTSPHMVTEMISKIDRFEIYNKVFKEYKDNKNYQLENGKPDIRKIKKEAVDKLIAEVIINKNNGEGGFPELAKEENQSTIRMWWNKIIDKIRGMYKATNIQIFQEAADHIMGDEMTGTIKDIETQGQYYQITDAQKEFADKINATKNSVFKRYDTTNKANPLLLDSEEADNYYEFRNEDGTLERVMKRVTDRVQSWYRDKFRGKIFSAEEQEFNDFKRKIGIKGHKDLEEIHSRYYDTETGQRRETPLDRPDKFNTESEEIYNELERYYTEVIKDIRQKSGGEPLVFSEVILYDKNEKEAGTVDFLAIEPSGKAHILDWKFMHFTRDEIAWFKEGAFNIQLGRYKKMLREQYGVKEFGLTRAIPFAMEFKRSVKGDPNSKLELKKIAVGSVDPSKLKDLRLVPIAEATESTGYTKLDKLIKKIVGLYEEIGKEEVKDEDEREFKIERLNVLRRAIRNLRGKNDMTELIKTVEVMRKDGDRILEDYEMIYKDKPATRYDSTDKELSDFSENMNNFIKFADVFINIDKDLGSLIYNPEMRKNAKSKEEIEELNELRDIVIKLRSEAGRLYDIKKEIEQKAEAFADKHIGQRNLVTGLTKAEAVVRGLFSRFRGVSELPLASLKLLFKLTRSAQGKASSDALAKVTKLMDIRKRLAAKYPDLRKAVQKLYIKDEKNKLVNKLIYKYKSEFHKTVDKLAASGGDKQWLYDNIDVKAYMEAAEKIIKKNIDTINRTSYEGEADEVEAQREEAIERLKRKWDITRKDFNGWNNYEIKRHPLDKWFSDEYLEIRSDKDLSDLYDFIVETNEEAKDIGYINGMVYKNFLPFVRKGTAEELVWDHTLSPMKNFSRNLKIKTDDVGYGEINKVTGELEHGIPKYYTYDFTYKDGVNDYSEVSEDLFKNMILYVQHVQKYKYMSEIEGQLKLVKTIETWKGHLRTNRTGEVVLDENNEPAIEEGNETNTKMYDNFLRVLLYDQKYVLSDEDAAFNVGKVVNFVKKGINRVSKKVTGKEVLSINEDSPTSMIKSIDAANRAFQLKTLGLEFISGAVNAFGGNIQIATQAGNYFKAREFLKNELKLTKNRFESDDEREMFIQLMDNFMPLKEDPNYEKYKQAGMSVLTRRNFADMLMVFMRVPEMYIEKATFLTLLDNMMVEDGKIVSIPEFVKAKYKDRFKSGSEYSKAKSQMKKEIEELKKTRSISKTKKLETVIEDGKEVKKLVIPGLDLTDKDELQRLTNLTRRISRNATGGMSDGDVNLMQMSIWTKSMMIFKNWIPKLTDTRFGEFRKISDDFSVKINDDGTIEGEKYDIGRIRLWFYVWGTSFRDKSMNILNILRMSDSGIKALDRMYEDFAAKYKKETGETLNMSKEDFMELIRTNLRNQFKELAILTALMALLMSQGAIGPGDDDDKAAKNKHNFFVKTLDKFVNELSFFYNPANYEGLLKGGIFPAVGLLTDASNFVSHFTSEVTGMEMFNLQKSTEDVRKDAMPVKYFFKMFPITKSLLNYLAMLDSDFAKEYDISISKESTIGR